MSALQQHWEQLQPRERRILLGGAIGAVLLLAYALVWIPFTDRLAQLENSVITQRGTLAWMQQAGAEVRTLRGTRPAAGSPQSLLALSDESAKAHRLGGAIKRVQPDGQHTVRVWLEGAAFDDVLRWLDTLAVQHGIRITGLNVERTAATPGQVNARVALEAAP
jgi:general secretion pathway protein M